MKVALMLDYLKQILNECDEESDKNEEFDSTVSAQETNHCLSNSFNAENVDSEDNIVQLIDNNMLDENLNSLDKNASDFNDEISDLITIEFTIRNSH
jgi:hypothetical protein